MSKSEIQSWLSAASPSAIDTNGEVPDPPSWQRDRVLSDWPRAMEHAQIALTSNKTKVRTQFLHDELLSLAKHGGVCASCVLCGLMVTI